MGITEVAVAGTLLVAAKMLSSTVFSIQAIVKGFSVAATFSELDMAPNFFLNRGRILAKLTANAFKRFSFHQSLFNDVSFLLKQMSVHIYAYPLKRHHHKYHNPLKN